ncbi:MAG TPA: hypothetical protein VNW93_02835, partial [Mycobacterium sp.]|nr:hypothetical protein [Mycobacterium sp.]
MTLLARCRLWARRASRFAFADFPIDELACAVPIAVLRDAGDVENAVDTAVAAEVEAVPDWQAG